jgi:hypothetical protein
MTYRGRNAARRAHKLAVAEAATKKRINLEIIAWERRHPPRVHPKLLEAVDYRDDHTGERRYLYECPPAMNDSPRVLRMPIMARREILAAYPQLGGPHMRTVDFRRVQWGFRADQSEIRWYTWELIGEAGDRENMPHARKAAAFIRQARMMLGAAGLIGIRPLESGRFPGFPFSSDWARKELDEVLEVVDLELHAWLGDVPAVRG